MKAFFTHLIGKRIIKTSIATFITAWICLWFDFPALFAVMTAIVTIEPTSSDSIRKGMIRFPAAALGAAFAMIFESWMGESALVYALAATLTILVCHKLRLDAGITVATLTALAMIPETQGHYVDSYLVRLATTLIGITVSTLINFSVLRPKFYPQISHNISQMYQETGELLTLLADRIKTGKKLPPAKYRTLSKQLEATFRLIHYEHEEWKYHRQTRQDVHQIHHAQKQLHNLQKALYHLGNLQYLNFRDISLSQEEAQMLNEIVTAIVEAFKNPDYQFSSAQEKWLQRLDDWFQQLDKEHPPQPHQHFPPRMVIAYELLSLMEVADDRRSIS